MKTFWLNIIFFLTALNIQAQVSYFVSPGGNDQNNGTAPGEPLNTISEALRRMQPGDTCYLREGIYRETIHIRKSNITIKAYDDERPVISGLDRVNDWKLNQNDIYFTTYTPDDKNTDPNVPEHLNGGRQFLEVFVDHQLATMGCWPNRPVAEILSFEKRGEPANIFVGGKAAFIGNIDPKFSIDQWEGAFFNGIMTKMWNDVQGVVASNTSNSLTCSWITAAWKKSTN